MMMEHHRQDTPVVTEPIFPFVRGQHSPINIILAISKCLGVVNLAGAANSSKFSARIRKSKHAQVRVF